MHIEPFEYRQEEGGIPIFKPSYEEFKDFNAFLTAIDAYGRKSGIVKIIPPPEFKNDLPVLQKTIKDIKVRNPIVQEITGFSRSIREPGSFLQNHIEVHRSYSVKEWFDLSNNSHHRPPKFNKEGRIIEEPNSNKKKTKTTSEETEVPNGKNQQVPLSDNESDPEDNIAYLRENEQLYNDTYIEQLEKFYWKNITHITPMYGADMLGTLYEPHNKSGWNMQHLDSLLTRIQDELPGVNKPYLYFGMWKATFAWHLEDMDLYSINYIHFGAPKQWYVIPTTEAQKFEKIASQIFKDEADNCKQFLRHKTCIITPKLLESRGIKVCKAIQRSGEFIITFPYGYHSGYNLGFNCAESVNFALDSWIPIGKKSDFCKCVGDSVKLDIDALFCKNDKEIENEDNQKVDNLLIKKEDKQSVNNQKLKIVKNGEIVKRGRGRPRKDNHNAIDINSIDIKKTEVTKKIAKKPKHRKNSTVYYDAIERISKKIADDHKLVLANARNERANRRLAVDN